MTTASIRPAHHLQGAIAPPGDKSISHRALMLSSLANGSSTISGLSSGLDVLATAEIFRQLGAEITDDGGLVTVVSSGALRAAGGPLDCGNSGTTMRLLAGILAGLPGRHQMIGDASLSKRPMDRVAIPLRLMGARVDGIGERLLPPIEIHGGALNGIVYEVPEPSAQVKSALLLAGLVAEGSTTVVEAVKTRTHTEEMLEVAGIGIESVPEGSGRRITVQPGTPRAMDWVVATDPSQAAFTVVAGLLARTGGVEILDLYPGEERIGFLSVLERMGATLSRALKDGRLTIDVAPSLLHGTTVQSIEIPSVDEVPILAVAALRAEGPTRFVDVGELRFKESDRMEATARLVRSFGGEARIEGDDLLVTPAKRGPIEVEIDPLGDHRLAMAASIAALSSDEGSEVVVRDIECISTSYPAFFEHLRSLGAAVEVEAS